MAHRRFLRVILAAAAISCILANSALARSSRYPSSPLSPFARAEHLQESLEKIPESERTRGDYERVLDAFRAIYHENPASPWADAGIDAVAGLLAEEGRSLGSEKSFRDAIGQYEFLRQQYPGSRYRFSALIAEGEIYRWDLSDLPQAKETFQNFLQTYPASPLADQAHAELKEMRDEESLESRRTRRGARKREAGEVEIWHQGEGPQSDRRGSGGRGRGRSSVLTAAIQSWPSPRPTHASDRVAQAELGPRMAPLASPATRSQTVESSPPRTSQGELHAVLLPHPVSLVTGIRHWSTPVYTRVAIDLQDQVAYEAARVPHPDRIYFDLYGTRLSRDLIGKSFQITDDGFLRRVRIAQFSGDVTRVVLDVSSLADYSAFLLPNPWRLIIDIHGRKGGVPPVLETATEAQPMPQRAASGQTSAGMEDGASGLGAGRWRPAGSNRDIAALGEQPDRIPATERPTTRPIAASVLGATPAPQTDDGSLASTRRGRPAVRRSSQKSRAELRNSPPSWGAGDPSLGTAREAEPTAAGERSLVRTLGLKIGRIVIDAGHGGHDSGTLGPDGMEEKDIVLDVALRLGKLLKQHLGADVIFTRRDDTFVPLETRTAIANKMQADLFISIHANSSSDPDARGVETYYLNFTTSPAALEVAARENAVSNRSVHQLSELVKKITLQDKIEESREFASDVQKALYDDLEEGNPGLKDRGVKQAPFVVLIGANMPSILAEISFLTNPDDARELAQAAYRQRIAESLYQGIANYIGGLSGVRLAQNPHLAGPN